MFAGKQQHLKPSLPCRGLACRGKRGLLLRACMHLEKGISCMIVILAVRVRLPFLSQVLPCPRLNLNTPPHTPLLVPFSGCLFQTQPLPRSYSCGLGCEVYDLKIPVPMMWVEGCGLLQTTLQQRVADASILSLSSSRPSWGTFIHVGADLGCCIAFVLQERNPTVS